MEFETRLPNGRRCSIALMPASCCRSMLEHPQLAGARLPAAGDSSRRRRCPIKSSVCWRPPHRRGARRRHPWRCSASGSAERIAELQAAGPSPESTPETSSVKTPGFPAAAGREGAPHTRVWRLRGERGSRCTGNGSGTGEVVVMLAFDPARGERSWHVDAACMINRPPAVGRMRYRTTGARSR